MASPQSNALAQASNLVQLMVQFENLSNSVDAYMKGYNQIVPDTYWQHMATVAVGTDGNPAGSNDATPNTANPINLPVANPILVSRSALINGVTMLGKFQTFMSQAGGTLTMSAQANVQTAALITG